MGPSEESPERKTERINVFLTHGYSFWRHTAVTVASLLEHNNHLDVHIFSDANDPYWFSKIQSLCPPTQSTVSFYPFDNQLTSNLKNCGYFGLAAYNRLFIPELFAGKARRLIYFDSDMVIRTSIRELADSPLDNCPLAAVPGFSKRLHLAKIASLGHGQQSHYFNAGLLVIDPVRWLEEGIRETCLDFGSRCPERVQLADQDMLNYAVAGRYKELPSKWNVVTELFSDLDGDDLENLSLDEIEVLRQNPCVVHFNGQYKPWHLTYKHPYRSDYLRLRRKLQKRPYISDDFPGVLLSKPLTYLRRQASR
jgi:lipopolysaccharide biosynthesis glycosyltransferase